MRHLDAADIRRDDHDFIPAQFLLLEIADDDRRGVEMIHRDVKEALNLSRMEVHGEDALHAGGGEEIGDELRGDGHARLVLPVLARVAKERNHRGDALGTGAARGVHHDEQFHQIVIRRRAGRLHDEEVAAADVLVDLHEGLAVRERIDEGIRAFHSEPTANAVRQSRVGGTAEDFHSRVHGRSLEGSQGSGKFKFQRGLAPVLHRRGNIRIRASGIRIHARLILCARPGFRKEYRGD